MRLICGSVPMLKEKPYIFPDSINSQDLGTAGWSMAAAHHKEKWGHKESSDKVWSLLSPPEHFWAPCAQVLSFLPNGRELGYSLKAQGLG